MDGQQDPVQIQRLQGRQHSSVLLSSGLLEGWLTIVAHARVLPPLHETGRIHRCNVERWGRSQ